MVPNPLMDVLSPKQSNPRNDPMTLLANFRDFAKTITPEGAKQKVEQLLASGQMSQEQYQQLQNQAKFLMQMFGIR